VGNYNDIRFALGKALKSFQPDLNVYYYMPRSASPPVAIIMPSPNQTINYMEAQTSRSAKWNFIVMVTVGYVDSEAAQLRVGELISPGSELLTVLNGKIGTGYSQVTSGSVHELMLGKPPKTALHTCARLSLIVLA
jgi:hypothetical protein